MGRCLGETLAQNFIRKSHTDTVFQGFWSHLCVFFEYIFMLRLDHVGVGIYVGSVIYQLNSVTKTSLPTYDLMSV